MDPLPFSSSSDEAAIRRLIILYGFLLDDRRLDDWAELFTPNAVCMGYTGRQAIVQSIAVAQSSRWNKHITCSSLIELSGGKALAWTDAFGLVDAGPTAAKARTYTFFPLRYYDQLVRDKSRWRFARRDVRLQGDPLPDGAVEVPGA